MPNDTTLPEFEIFRAGTHVDSRGREITVTPADLAAVAASYDPSVGEAPLVIGHPKINGPAHGWVSSLRAEGDLLLATPHQVESDFAASLKARRYKKRSASFFLPGSPGNPRPGQMYLRHVGFLGAAAPAVAGLRDIQFSADDDGIAEFTVSGAFAFREIASLFRKLRDYFIERDGTERADALLPAWSVDSIAEASRPEPEPVAAEPNAFSAPDPEPAEVHPMSDQNADFAARESALADRERQLAEREQQLQQQALDARRADVAEFVAAQVAGGRVLPRDVPRIEALLFALEGVDDAVEFAAEDGTPTSQAPAALVRDLLMRSPAQVDFSERSQGVDPALSADFVAPAGSVVARDGLETFARARAYLAQNPNTPWLDAVRAVSQS